MTEKKVKTITKTGSEALIIEAKKILEELDEARDQVKKLFLL